MFFYVTAVLALSSVASLTAQTDDEFQCPKVPQFTSNFIRHPQNCSVFYSCVPLHQPQKFCCPVTLVFSQSSQVCVAVNSYLDDCGRILNGGILGDPLCSRRPNGTNVDPADCHRFIPCFEHNSYPSMACPGDLAFLFEENRCVNETLVSGCH